MGYGLGIGVQGSGLSAQGEGFRCWDARSVDDAREAVHASNLFRGEARFQKWLNTTAVALETTGYERASHSHYKVSGAAGGGGGVHGGLLSGFAIHQPCLAALGYPGVT